MNKNYLQKLLAEKRTIVMGILNVTPDSFSDGGLYFSLEKAVKRAKEMLEEGADIIDIGGESTRPGAEKITCEEELRRVIPVISVIRKVFGGNVLISVDTYKAQVAKMGLEKGVDMINSLGGFTFDKNIAKVVAAYQCPIVIYHTLGTPKKMQKNPKYMDVIEDIAIFFEEQIAFGIFNGMKKDQFVLDPGIGFGKTLEQNIEIIKRFSEFGKLELPLLVGVSRKSHLGKILQDGLKLSVLPSPLERLEASFAETAAAVLNGAKIVRTHDVLQTKKFLTVLDRIKYYEYTTRL